MGRPTLPVKSPKRLQGAQGRRRSGILRSGSTGSSGSTSGSSSGGGVSANIKVAVRVRPENTRERAGQYGKVVSCIDERMLVFDPKEDEDDFFYQGKKQKRDLNKKQKKDQKFAFDAVYGPDSTNDQVFEGTTKSLVETIFEGYNCSVFAYGATGAGKTFTMLGGGNQLGLTFLTMKEIYGKISEVEESKSCEVAISYLEVYNETVLDLLNPGAQILQVREDGKATSIPGLTLHKPSGPEAILELLKFGNGNRTQHATDANSESSRSHAVLQVFLRQKDKGQGLSGEVKVAKMSLIDLAGSEKGGVTAGRAGQRFREGSNINKSLLALGSCINNLAEGAKYIPYRNSKLTRLLKDSIGGNCRTVMIANVSPSAETFEDTFNTLKYADRAKKIKINLKANVLSVNFQLSQYTKIVEDLKEEISGLKERIQELEEENRSLGRAGARPRVDSAEDMVVDSTEGTVAAAAEARTAEVEELTRTLNRYIERQQDYDALQARLAEAEARIGQQAPREVVEEESKEPEDLIPLQDPLTSSLAAHAALVARYTEDKVTVARLSVRIRFRRQLAVRSDKLAITQGEREKVKAKADKVVGGLEKKLARLEGRVETLAREMEASSAKVVASAGEDSDPWKAKYAAAELARIETSAKAEVSESLLRTLGTKVETMDGDLASAVEMLKKDQMLLRAHDILTKEDLRGFDQVKERLLEMTVQWGGREDNEGCSAGLGTPGGSSLPSPALPYLEAARTHLPNLPASRNLGPSLDETEALEGTLAVSSEASLAPQEEQEEAQQEDEEQEEVPSTPQPARVSALRLPCVRGTPQPSLALPKPPPPRPGDTTLFHTPSPTSLPSTATATATAQEEPDTTSPSSPHPTPKRLSSPLSPELQSATKRPRVEWRQEQTSAGEDSESETATLDGTYEAPGPNDLTYEGPGLPSIPSIPSIPPTEEAAPGLNDTQVLSTRLDRGLGLDSPQPKPRPPLAAILPSVNSTFAVEVEEPMEVDATGRLPLSSSLDPSLLNDVSIISAPPGTRSPRFSPRTRSASPIRAGLGVRSPSFIPKRSPSPLRQSTMLDLKSTSSTTPALAQPRRSPRSDFLAPTPRTGGSALRARGGSREGRGRAPASATTPQPARKAAPPKKVLKHSASVGVLPSTSRARSSEAQGRGFMAATQSSRTKGAAGQVKDPEGGKGRAGTIASSVSNRLDKLKKQISGTNVLKPSNKS